MATLFETALGSCRELEENVDLRSLDWSEEIVWSRIVYNIFLPNWVQFQYLGHYAE